MFLVVLRHECDDLPLKIFADEDRAMDFAKSITAKNFEKKQKVACQILGIDATTPCSVFVYWYAPNGDLIGARCVVDITEFALTQRV